VEYPGRSVSAQVWRVDVGRVPLYLLDTNIPENPLAEDRDITDQLYGGDLEMRLRQEVLLGIGGYRALEALGIEPGVFHMNEGHSAFLALERVRRLAETKGLSFAEARELASCGLVFTGHTPVMAGHDYFSAPSDRPLLRGVRGIPEARPAGFLALGRKNPNGRVGGFLHDGPGAADGGVPERRQPASREDQPGDVAKPLARRSARRDTDRSRDQRGPLRSWLSNDVNQLFGPVPQSRLARGARR